jgi:hypothetical protein
LVGVGMERFSSVRYWRDVRARQYCSVST